MEILEGFEIQCGWTRFEYHTGDEKRRVGHEKNADLILRVLKLKPSVESRSKKVKVKISIRIRSYFYSKHFFLITLVVLTFFAIIVTRDYQCLQGNWIAGGLIL